MKRNHDTRFNGLTESYLAADGWVFLLTQGSRGSGDQAMRARHDNSTATVTVAGTTSSNKHKYPNMTTNKHFMPLHSQTFLLLDTRFGLQRIPHD